MISYKIWSTIKEKLSNTNPYMSVEILNWMKFKYYLIVNWKRKTFFSGKFELFVTWWVPSFDKWWILISITKQFLYPKIYDKILLTYREPYMYLNHTDEEGWILVDVKQAGKYIFSN